MAPLLLWIHLEKNRMTRIVAMDTETQDGYAILITVPFMFQEVSSWESCMDFLSLKPLRELACWNADYDVQAILKYLPSDVRERLSIWGEAVHGPYKIKYVPHKFAKVWKDNGRREVLLFTIYDMKQFYSCSLSQAAKLLGVQAKKDFPVSWYKQMFIKLHDPKARKIVLDYALGDAQTLQQIIDRTVESFRLAGMKFEKPYSNASFSERFFRKRMGYRRNKKVEQTARKAYFGGRIECLQTGFFPVAYFYDIHSAYPSIIADLIKPNGRWFYEKTPNEIFDDAVYGFLDCTVDIPATEHVGPIPIRKRSDNGIIYPVGRFRRILTLTEYQFLQSRKWISRIHAGWIHRFPTWDKPFRQIREMYQRRKENKRVDYALKIVMNSLYGKFAQMTKHSVKVKRITSRTSIHPSGFYETQEEDKDYTSFVYASEITARIRTRLLQDIPPEKVISYATDGVFTTEKIDIPQGDGLGEWGTVKEVRNLIVVGSGIYQYTADGKTTVRFRGFSPDIDLQAMLKQAGRRHVISRKVLRNLSLKLSAKRKEHSSLNILRETKRLLNVNFDTKRVWPKRWSASELTERSFSSRPKIYLEPIRFKKIQGAIYARMPKLSGKRKG